MILDAIRLVSSCLNSKGVTSLEPSSSNTVKQLFTSGEKVNMGSPPSQSFNYSSNHRKSRLVSLIAYDCGRVRTGDHRTIITSNAKLGTLPNCSTAQPRNSKRASPADGSTSWRVRAPLHKHKVTWHPALPLSRNSQISFSAPVKSAPGACVAKSFPPVVLLWSGLGGFEREGCAWNILHAPDLFASISELVPCAPVVTSVVARAVSS